MRLVYDISIPRWFNYKLNKTYYQLPAWEFQFQINVEVAIEKITTPSVAHKEMPASALSNKLSLHQ
jgi:hypothetical protein